MLRKIPLSMGEIARNGFSVVYLVPGKVITKRSCFNFGKDGQNPKFTAKLYYEMSTHKVNSQDIHILNSKYLVIELEMASRWALQGAP